VASILHQVRKMARLPELVLNIALAASLASCGGDGGSQEVDCTDNKCDLPDDPLEISCERRRSDAFNPNKLSFNKSFLRWSCNDVQGVTLDDRGQEYCEYFAIAQVPDGTQQTPAPRILGKNLGDTSEAGTTKASLDLTKEQRAALEAAATEVVGQCVFTSWNSDIDTPDHPLPLPCAKSGSGCPSVLGVPVAADTFRMTFGVNSAEAAQVLVEDCLDPLHHPDPPLDERQLSQLESFMADPDPFMRGCLIDAVINETEFRKSDTNICASMNRLAECGCTVSGKVSLGELISPWTERGFRLGTWSGFVHGSESQTQLKAGCRYISVGDNSQTLVSCDLTAEDVLKGQDDVRAFCQQKYADDVVVYVPVDPTPVVCNPDQSESAHAGTCSATPWIVTP
jgi:hypothetical protein